MSGRATGGPAFGDVIKRWVNEAQEAVASDSVMVQVSQHLFQFLTMSPCDYEYRPYSVT